MNENKQSFLGTGWIFPPEFSKDLGSVELVSDIEDIRQSLHILLSTSLGERVMQPNYGCNLNDYLFEPLNSTTIGFIKDRVENSILYYEPRIVVESITVTPAGSTEILEGKFVITIDFTIPETNTRYNYVYDFYLTEASESI